MSGKVDFGGACAAFAFVEDDCVGAMYPDVAVGVTIRHRTLSRAALMAVGLVLGKCSISLLVGWGPL